MSRLTLQTADKYDYSDVVSLNGTITTKCAVGNKLVNSYTCAYPDGSTYNIKVKCDGKSDSTISTICPKVLSFVSIQHNHNYIFYIIT